MPINKHQAKPKINGRIWLETAKGPLLGYGRIEILENIQRHGSITQAAAEMNMSYRQAWELVESMNANAENPLVVKQTGGKGGGGALLTPYGKSLMSKFIEVNARFQEFLLRESERLKEL